MTNEQLVSIIQHSAGEAKKGFLDQLYHQNINLIRTIALHFPDNEVDDLMQEGAIGLIVAADSYDPTQGASFATYSYNWIRQSISRYAYSNRSAVRIPEQQLQKVIHYRDILQSFLLQYDREPSDKELQSLLKLSAVQLERLKQDMLMFRIRSLDEPIQSADGGLITIEETIPDRSEDAYTRVLDSEYNKSLSLVLWSVVDAIGATESHIIRERYQNNKTIKQICEETGLTQNEVMRFQGKAFKGLRESRKLKRFIDRERIISASIHKSTLSYFRRTGNSAVDDAALKLQEV